MHSRNKLLFATALALAGCKSGPPSAEKLADGAKKKIDKLETLRRDLASDGLRGVGYRSARGGSGMSCIATKPHESGPWKCTAPAAASANEVPADQMAAALGATPVRYKHYLDLLEWVDGEDAKVAPNGALTVTVGPPSPARGFLWCPRPAAGHAETCQDKSRRYVSIESGWYAWE
jgi:hypothetical protein